MRTVLKDIRPERPRSARWNIRVTVAVALVVGAMLISSCTDAVSSALGLTSVNASDGTYRDRIELSWDAVTDSDASGNARTVSEYEISRSPTGVPFPVSVAQTQYTDTSADPGVSYSYSVTATFSDGATKAVDLSDTGYAMDATQMQIHSSPNDGSVSYDSTGSAKWFNFLGQEGWVYRVTVTGTPSVSLYREGNIGTDLIAISSVGGVIRYRLPRTGNYHLKLDGSSGTVSVSHE